MAVSDLKQPIVRRAVCILTFLPVMILCVFFNVLYRGYGGLLEAVTEMMDGFTQAWRGSPVARAKR